MAECQISVSSVTISAEYQRGLMFLSNNTDTSCKMVCGPHNEVEWQ